MTECTCYYCEYARCSPTLAKRSWEDIHFALRHYYSPAEAMLKADIDGDNGEGTWEEIATETLILEAAVGMMDDARYTVEELSNVVFAREA